MTSITASGHTITVTKGATYATSADLATVKSTADSASATASTAVQSVSGSNGITTSKSGTAITVKGVTANTSTIGVAYLHTSADCTSFSSDNGGATPAAVKKAITTEATQPNGIFNATSTHRGTMSKEDKAKLDAFGAASTYALKSDLTGFIKASDVAFSINSNGELVVTY